MTVNESSLSFGLSVNQSSSKRIFDFSLSLVGIAVIWPIILLAWIAISISDLNNGFYIQSRVGRHGYLFKVVKIRTMRPHKEFSNTVTMLCDPRITPLGAWMRKYKIDELPQLFNVLIGNMSFVGPRPDVPGFADQLTGRDRIILSVRPGITGPASLKYRDEEKLLAKVNDPTQYNRDVLYPDKVRLNREYIEKWSFRQDLRYIWWTVRGRGGV